MSLTPFLQRNPGPCDGFDVYAGKRWIYPNNMTIRGYQKAAVELALYNNSMIVLPTGFGKTFIAAVVMYNFYRWYPQGKIIFVAPTRPLVAQQIQECRKISGIPASDCVELTGIIGIEKRRNFWKERRVFFATPQVIDNDLENGLLSAKLVRCIVIDEAHRAQGNFAYVNIVRHLQENNRNGFRVLALSATPGSDIQKVQQVMLNLYISEVMFRSETSIDLMQYRNEKCSRAWTVELVGKHRDFVDKFIALSNPIFKDLFRAGVIYTDSIERVAKYSLVKAMTSAEFNERAQNGTTRGRLKYLCAAAMSLSHNFELLTLYGIRVFYTSLKRSMQQSRSAIKTVLAGKVEYEKLMTDIEKIFRDDCEPDPTKKAQVDLLQGHPKLCVVKDLLIKHFEENEGKAETRAIVFTKFRESVYDIVQAMQAYDPLIKAAPFVGQGAGSSKKNKEQPVVGGMSQREQIELIAKFKEGVYNVIVATCVAEEGLDIGEVDLIICYDTSSSPISTTQRRGRTGRKRSGDVQTILTKGYEEKKLQKAGASKRQVEDQLYKKENYTPYKYREAPRMVPAGVIPICLEQKVYPVNDEPEEKLKPKKKKQKKLEEVMILDGCDKKKRIDDSQSSSKGEKSLCQSEKSLEEDWDSDDEIYDLFSPSK